MRVLVVDDEVSVSMLASFVLRDAGFEVEVAATGQAALGVLREPLQRFHVVLVDRDLSDMAGDEVAVEALAQKPEIAVVMALPHGTPPPRCDAWVRKPYRPSDLVMAISAALVGRSTRRMHGSRRTTET